MKRLFLLFLLPNCLFAQEKRFEFDFGYGTRTTINVIEKSADGSATGLSAGMTRSPEMHTGSFHVGYKYFDDSQRVPVAIGGTFLYERLYSEAFRGNVETGSFDNNYYSLIGEMNIIYFDKHHLLLYGIMAAGATFYTREFTSVDHQKDVTKRIHLNFQLTPVGIKYGDRIGIYAELGLGCKGILCGGVFTRF